MNDFGEGPKPSPSEIKVPKEAEKSPSLSYNLAILEAFQRSCQRANLPEGHKDDQREVILFGGSYGRGTASWSSDYDLSLLTEAKVSPGQQYDSREHVLRFLETMGQELNSIIAGDPALRNYVKIGQEVTRRQLERVREFDKLHPLGYREEMEKRGIYNGGIKVNGEFKSGYLYRGTNQLVDPETAGYLRGLRERDEEITHLRAELIEKIKQQIAAVSERAGFSIDTKSLPLSAHSLSVEIHNENLFQNS
jgi:hypothetical protein